MHLHLRFRRIVALVAGLLLTLSIHAQVITKSFRGVPLKTVLEEVEKQTGYSFLFESKEVDVDKSVTASFKNATIQTVLDKVLDGSLRYTINDKLVTISQRPRQGATVAKDGSVTLSGTVISSSDNQPIVGANVYVEGTTLGVTTDIDGNYSLTVPASTRQVTFSFLGYDMKKIAVKDSELFKLVTLVDASNELEDVVVVGFGVQKKESLVGAVQSVKPSELQVSSSNLSTSFAGKIAGVIVPLLDEIKFEIGHYSLFNAPAWYTDGIELLKKLARTGIEAEFSGMKLELLEHARKKTTQKVNLFEKVQIPGYKDAIRKVKRFMEDEESLSKSSQKIMRANQEKRKAKEEKEEAEV
jgi:V/A-type H+-transporting ATPase subunit D